MIKGIFLIGSEILVTREALIAIIGSQKTVESAVTRGQIKPVKRGQYNFDSLGNWQSKVLEFLGFQSKEALLEDLHLSKESEKQKELSSKIAFLPEKWSVHYVGMDEKYYQDKYNVNYNTTNGNRAREMAISISILRFIYANREKAIRVQNTGIEKMEDLQKAICEYLQNRTPKLYGLPTSLTRLRGYYYDFCKAISEGTDPRDVIVSEKYNNSNAQKFDEIHLAVLKEVYLRSNKPDLFISWNDYSKIMLQEYSMEPVKYSRFKQICSQSDLKILAARCREGRGYYEVHVRPFHLRKPPEFNFSLVNGDGWVPGRSITHKVKGKDGVVREVSSGMSVWFWMDWKSSAILGWRISHAESSHDIRQSFRDILNLHGGYCPRSVMIDKKWQTQPDLERMFEKAGVFTQDKRAYNPKSALIERLNKEMNKHHRRLDQNWVNMTPGYGQATRHNAEEVDLTPLKYDAFVELVTTIFNAHNNEKLARLNGKTPLEDLYSNINPDCVTFDPMQRLWIFGQKRVETVRNHTVNIQIASKKYQFIIPEDQIETFIARDVKYNKVKVYFDEKFMESADLYEFQDENDDTYDRYICSVVNADSVRYNVAQVEMKKDDWAKFNKQQRRGKIVDDYIKRDLEEKEQILDATNFDRASVYKVSQEKYKEANASEMGQRYTKYYEEVEKEEGNKVLVAEPKKGRIDHKEKFKKLKGRTDDFND